jgi:hypothetical protein
MDFVKDITGGNKNNAAVQGTQGQQSSGGFMNKVNNMAGGGASGTKNEDLLDKGWFQLSCLHHYS